MERLTQWIDENTAIPRVDLRRCGHERCTTQLASANVNHFFTLLGKMFFTPYGKEFFTSLSKQIFTS